MTTLLNVDSLTQRSGADILFSELKISLSTGSRLGIIGPNGSGKSTLLRLLSGTLEPDQGRVVRARDARVTLVAQQENFDADQSVLQAALTGIDSAAMAKHESESRAAEALNRVGFEDTDQTVATLSGGWKKRLALASALAQDPDFLLLDEPTNHLDLNGLLWLERLLHSASFGWALVSHDRLFLERTVSSVLEIAPFYENGSYRVAGSYTEFIEKREDFLRREAQKTASLANKVRRETAWAARSPKARTGKARYRLNEATRLQKELSQRKARQQKGSAKLSFSDTGRKTKELIELKQVCFGYEERVIVKDLDFLITNGMCLGVLGANGQGKSTLLGLIGGRTKAQSGTIKHAGNLRIAYFDQMRAALDPSATLRDSLGDGHDHVLYRGSSIHLIGWAKRFALNVEDFDSPIEKLSGGQQARLLLSKLAREEADVLILDEPSNDLDISMLEALESMLLEFEGAVILVTHDRYMLNEVCTDFVGFDTEGLIKPFADYQQWEKLYRSSSKKKKSKTKPEKKSKPRSKANKLSYKDQRELEQIEAVILKAEEELERLEAEAANPEIYSDAEKSVQVSQALGSQKEQVDSLYKRWEELEALKRSFEQG